jgi:hypothetical protein
VQSLFPFQTGPTPPQFPVPYFAKSNGSPNHLLYDLQPENISEGLVECPLLPQM